MPLQRSAMARRARIGCSHRKDRHRVTIASPGGCRASPKLGYRVASAQGGFVMSPDLSSTLDRLGDEIAELSAHLDAATARLLDLIREFDARGGWNTGFLSCAGWLTWRGRPHPGAPRGGGRGARAVGPPPPPGRAPAPGGVPDSQGPAPAPRAPPAARGRALAGR